jgi:hypothetical protein
VTVWESPLKNLRVAAVFAGAVAILAFLNSLNNTFAFDDLYIILENPGIQSLETLPEALVSPYWPGEYGKGLGLWRPMVTGVFGLEWALWGENPVAYHLVNILLHGGVTVLVVLLLGGFLPVQGAFLGGLLFALHPVHVEAVANVVGMAEVQAAFFFLLAALLVQRGGERLPPGRLALVLLFFALAFLTKESAITLMGIVLLLDASHEDLTLSDLPRYLRNRRSLYGGLILVSGLLLFARFQILGSLAQPFAPLGAHLLEEIPRIWTVASTWPHLFRLMVYPQDLVSDYSPAVIPIALGWNAVNVVGALMVLATLVFALFAWRRGSEEGSGLSPRWAGWGVVWFVITLSPTANIVFLSGILLSERTLYLPSVGFVAGAAWLLLSLHKERPRLAVGAIVLALSLMAGRSWTRTPTWENNSEVFNTLIREHPEAGRSQWVLGDSYFQMGNMSAGLRSYRLAVGIIGGHYTLLVEIGQKLQGAGYDRAAEVLLSFAWEDEPDLGHAPGLLAPIYDRQGRFVKSGEAARAALARDSTLFVHHHLLSRSLAAQGRLEEARASRMATIRFADGDHWQQWAWLAELEVALGDTVGALAAMDSALIRGGSVEESRQIDSLFSTLGLRQEGETHTESARDSQNPSTSGGGSEKDVPPDKSLRH